MFFQTSRLRPCGHTARIALFLTLTATTLAATLSKGPYLQAPSTDAMTIRWETTVAEPATLRFGEGTRLNQTVGPLQPLTVQSGTNSFYVYEANLKGLRPNTSYSYEVTVGADRVPAKEFKTFGTKQERVTFIAYGDTRTNPDKHAAVVANFRRHSPDFILRSSRGSCPTNPRRARPS